MITINLEKDLELQRYFVTKWVFTPKTKYQSIPVVPGILYHIPLNEIPEGFYSNSKDYFFEDGVLRKYPR